MFSPPTHLHSNSSPASSAQSLLLRPENLTSFFLPCQLSLGFISPTWFTFFFFFGLFGGAPAAFGGSQAKGQTGAVAADHSHSNVGSQPRLRPTSQLTAMLDL